MADIPVIDFAKAITGTRGEKEAVAKAIDHAFQDVGFVHLKNHSVPLELVEECFEWVRWRFSNLIFSHPHPQSYN